MFGGKSGRGMGSREPRPPREDSELNLLEFNRDTTSRLLSQGDGSIQRANVTIPERRCNYENPKIRENIVYPQRGNSYDPQRRGHFETPLRRDHSNDQERCGFNNNPQRRSYSSNPQNRGKGVNQQNRANGTNQQNRNNSANPQNRGNGARPRNRSNGFNPQNRDNGPNPQNRGNLASPYNGHKGAIPKNRGPVRQTGVIGFRKLQELDRKPPTEVLFYLSSELKGFKELLNQHNLFEDKDKMRYIWSVISIACRSDQQEHLTEFLKCVNNEQTFTVITLQQFLLRVQHRRCQQEDVQTLENITAFLETLQVLHPSVTLSTMTLVLPIMKETIETHVEVIGQGLLDRLHRLQEVRIKARERYTMRFDHLTAVKGQEEPSDSFRDIPIFPDRSDIVTNTRPFLRPNIVEGRYKDVDHYLDVQFRLLREDFVRPLREGIAAYQQQQLRGDQGRLNDIKVYQNVEIVQSMITADGILHDICFPITAELKRINWESTKRFIFGSLLCFTTDNFQTMLFATVANRNAEKLEKGNLCIRFDQKTILEVDKDYERKYLMIETDSYFEAYRHILTALQEISVETFPLQEYIVNVEKEIKPPKYAEPVRQKYCFGPLLPTFCMEKAIENLGIRSRGRFEEINTCDCPFAKLIPIHSEREWPDLNLDVSQLKALKCALTQSLSIIQGPPGTGKTYVGLKIVELLLHNRHVWAPKEDTSPILVVCYTNHALDQFLEGILKSTENIVRIGGRSKSTVLEQYNLRELGRKVNNRNYRDYTFRNRREAEYEIKEASRMISELEKKQKQCESEVLSEDELSEIISYPLLTSLMNNIPNCISPVRNSGLLIFHWLGIDVPQRLSTAQILSGDFREGNSDSEMEIDISKPYNDVEVGPTTEPIEVDDFTDAFDHEFLNDQRMVDNEFEDSHILFNRHERGEIVGSRKFTEKNEWKTQGGEKARRNFVKKNLKCGAMTAKEIQFCANVWSLKPEDRWRLYRVWLDQYIKRIENEMNEHKNNYERQVVLLEEVKHERERIVISDAQVVGLTTTGAAKYKHLIRGMKSKIVIVEEAAEVLEAHIVTALNPNTQHLILIGDHQQLRPNPTVYELAEKYNLKYSLFERMIENRLPFCMLNIQHRMKPCISKLLVPSIYKELEDHQSVRDYEDIKGMESSMFFLSHNIKEFSAEDSKSRVNIHEIDYLVELCRYLLLQGYNPSRITILTTYLAQFFSLKRKMVGTLKEVRVSVVDNFQGEEADIILLSFVRSNDDGNIGFLKTENRVCVALSRAKQGMYCVGNFELLASKSKIWATITDELRKQNAIGEVMNIKCQNHGNVVPMKTAADFFKVSDGGCLNKCDYRLMCGHVCHRHCHPDDQDHEKYQCAKPCDRILCERNHRCPKVCWKECGDCVVYVRKTLPLCQHMGTMPCHLDPSKFVCRGPCQKILSCGHTCLRECGTACGECKTIVSRHSACGHTVRIECRVSVSSAELVKACTSVCERALDCGHGCTNRCSEKCIVRCQVKLDCDLLCGHKLKISCFTVSMYKYSHWITKLTNVYNLEDHCSMGHSVLYRSLNDKSKISDLEGMCTVPCNQELECGHICQCTCGQCLQGRLHVACLEVCGKMLTCGHLCPNPCSSSCPPCAYECKNRCVHSRCTLVCGSPCIPCKEPCTWQCKHYSCTHRCFEPCNRPPCNRLCTKKLKCGHKCIGMCGEPCPKMCRTCNADEVTAIFFGDEDHPEARFVELEDCGHLFEIRGITKWFEDLVTDNAEIQLISCPLCKAPVHKNLRFNSKVKQAISKVEAIKIKIFGLQNENDQIARNLLSQIVKSTSFDHVVAKSTDPCLIFEAVKWQLELGNRTRPINQEKLALYGNYFTFAEKNVKILNDLNTLKEVIYTNKVQGSTNRNVDFFGSTLREISQKMLDNMQRGSQQLMQDISWEIRRLEMSVNFFKRFLNVFNSCGSECKTKIGEAIDALFSNSPFRETKDEMISKLSSEITKLSEGLAVLGVTDEERISILKAMGMKQGHWYQCPNGHVYCITECGGATEEGRCSECGAAIGGGSHRLRDDNRVATAMDGARSSAYGMNANMDNFDLNNLL